MSKSIYIATSEPSSGKSIVTLGLMSMLIGKTAKVGYFRPIIEDIELLRNTNALKNALILYW